MQHTTDVLATLTGDKTKADELSEFTVDTVETPDAIGSIVYTVIIHC